MDAMELKTKRINNLKNVVTGKGKVEYIPHFGNYFTWIFYDSGYTLSEALLNYDNLKDAMDQFTSRYSVDMYGNPASRNPIKVSRPLKPTIPYLIDDDRYSVAINDQAYMEDDEYDELIADPRKYLWEKFLPRKYEVFRNENNSVDFRDFVMRFLEFGGATGEIDKMMVAKGIPPLVNSNTNIGGSVNSFELLFNAIRGMKDLSVDLRRRPGKVEAAIEALDEVFIKPKIAKAMAAPNGTTPDAMFDHNMITLGHVILSPKQFERFFWPGLKRAMDLIEKKDHISFFFSEGSMLRFAEFFQELPANRFLLLSELDDPYELRKALPNVTIAAGPDSDLLGCGTPEENVAYAKKLIEDIGGEDHRFVFGPRKMVSYPNDCKRENLLAICNYLDNLRF